MAGKLRSKAMTPKEVRAAAGTGPTVLEVTFPKKNMSAAEAKAALAKWQGSIKQPQVTQPAPKGIKAVMLTSGHLTALRKVHESDAPTAEALKQDLTPEQLLGIVYSAFVVFNYTKLAAQKREKATSSRATAAAAAEWKEIVDGGTQAFSAAGLRGLKQADLDKMASELQRNKANFNAVATIANSAVGSPLPDSAKLGIGNYVTQTGVRTATPTSIGLPANICSQPLVQGSYTKHFGQCFSLQVTFNAPCVPKFWKTCQYTVTLAGLCYNVDLSVGYKVTCCGASAWGQAGASVCGTVVGITVCAACTASLIGIAGLSRNAVGGQCTYGLGVVADLRCTFGGVTVMHVSYGYGWTFIGPCPPPNFPCP